MTEVAKKETKACSVKGCKRAYRAKGYCSIHFKKWRRGEIEGHKPRYRICGEEHCRKPTFKKGYCSEHYSAWAASKKVGAAAVATPAAETPAAKMPDAEATA